VFCWLTFYLGLWLRGDYSSNLFWVLVFLIEWLRHRSRPLIGEYWTSYPPSPVGPITLLSSALVALLFPLTLSLLYSKRKALRWAGIVLLVLLGFFGLFWFRTPTVF